MSQVAEIRVLQELDDEAAAYRAALEDVERRLRGSEALNEARRAFAVVDDETSSLRKDQRRIDGQVESLTARILPEEKRLYDGSVKNPKELSSIQHELELLKEQRSKLEDELLDVLSRLEVADREYKVSRTAVLRLETAWNDEQQALTHEAKRLGDSIARSEAKRAAQKPKLTPRAFQVYDEVRRRRGGMAVARIQGSACGGCRVSIPDAVRKRAFASDQIPQCPNCERILYIG